MDKQNGLYLTYVLGEYYKAGELARQDTNEKIKLAPVFRVHLLLLKAETANSLEAIGVQKNLPPSSPAYYSMAEGPLSPKSGKKPAQKLS